MENEVKELGNVVKKGFKVLLKAALIGVGVTVLGGVVGGVIASAAALGGLATFGAVALGVIGGSYAGGALAKNYVASKSGPALVAVGNFVDAANKELEAAGQKPVEIPGLTPKFEEAKATAPVVAAPAVVAPVVTEQKPTAPAV